jgi:ABC-2 type transport system ATP-binding protein
VVDSPDDLIVQDLQKSFGGVTALAGVSLRLQAGERVALLGPNGAGKTTLVRCLCGRTRPTGGTLQLLGKPLTPSTPRRRLGIVPQEIALYADLTARENLLAFARFHGLRGTRLRARVAWALEWTGLAARAEQLVGGFSGGMKRRVNLACGVMHEPKVLLLDEPTVGVDPQSRQRIFEMLEALNRLGTSILLTTHHLDEAESACDRIVILDHGQVVAEGTLAELVQATVGTKRRVRLQVEAPPPQPVTGWTLGPDARTLEARIEDVGGQLPALLESAKRAGCLVSNVEVQRPSLHHVFLHLTGHALRD